MLVVTHCAPFTSIPIIEEGWERVITVQGSVYAHLSYSSVEGRLKILGVPKARHAEVAERFAAFVLGRPGFSRDRKRSGSTPWRRWSDSGLPSR